MIITVDLEKESAAGLRRAAKILEEAAAAKEPVQEFTEEIPAVVHGTRAPETEQPEPEPPKKATFGSLKVY